MGAQLNIDPGNSGDDPRQVLAGWLDDYAADRCERADVREIFSSVSRSNTETPWIALALLDQYQRLGRIDQEFARELKTEVNQVAFGVAISPPQAQPTIPEPVPADAATRNPDTTALDDSSGGTGESSHQRDADNHAPLASVQEQDEEPAAASKHRVLRDRYELVELISRDAIGSTYRALDRQRSNLPQESQYVCIRLVRLNETNLAASWQEIQRGFYRAQSLTHANIRSVFDVEVDDDTSFAVMELLHGERLSALLENCNSRPIPWPYARNILRGIGAALVYAHDRGIVHGNLQPGNVVITTAGEVKILEFGFAAPSQREPWISDANNQTLRADPFHHPAEVQQAIELTKYAVDDVFSLACIAFELLSGHRPYEKRSALYAITHNNQPVRSIRFNQRQWRVLRQALAPARAGSNMSIRELLVGLGCDQPPQQLPSATAIASDVHSSSPLRSTLLVTGVLVATAFGAYMLLRPQHSVPAQDQTVAATSASSSVSTQLGNFITAPPSITVTDANTPDPATTPDILPATQKSPSVAKQSVSFTQDSFVASEREGAAKLLIRRAGQIDKPLRMRWSTIGDSARPGNDFAESNFEILEIPAGARQYTLVIPLASDSIKEGTEFFTVKMNAVGDSALKDTATAEVIIVDDD